jgi:hypothetical protein
VPDGEIVILKDAVAVLLAASFTCTVNDAVAAVVGVPEITPVDATRLNPAGNEPELIDQVYGVVPPLACSVAEYAVPTVPPGNDAVVTVACEPTVRLAAVLVIWPSELLTSTWKVEPFTELVAGGVV